LFGGDRLISHVMVWLMPPAVSGGAIVVSAGGVPVRPGAAHPDHRLCRADQAPCRDCVLIVEQKNAQFAPYAKINKFAVLPAEFARRWVSTPTLKLKRKFVAMKMIKTFLESLLPVATQ
jgi:hypothetical protein